MSNIPEQIKNLVNRFRQNIESYRSPGYNETQTRQEFINPFFEVLGWDVSNAQGYAEAYKDVIHEDAIKIGKATKAPDYSFRIGGERKFFLEAKKPSIGIKDDIGAAYQLRRYAWSAKLPLSILTNFCEFSIYDCRFSPKQDDKASVGRILYFTFDEYSTCWDQIASVFSKDAVLRGSFDKFAVSGRGKRGTTEVDSEFLNEIEIWRDSLARNLALRNPELTVRDLNFAVQRTIDRLIFLRMCEDRGIEDHGQLQYLLDDENIYEHLRHLFERADDRYNSGIFHFTPEKGREEAPDKLTPTLTIDDKVLRDIIRRLYYPESPYEFSVLGADILGNVYEQFLGKVIRLTSGHRAVIEEKPEVKRAGGVYYTPGYIVNYIVENTLGRICEEKTPKQITKVKIVDPACGSGSFLIAAYTFLLNYHRDWYFKNGPDKYPKEVYRGSGGQWLLTTQEKKRILLNNIYGVDIDSQAVEVTKLSLLLKVLEGENQETLNSQLKMWHERALPDLGRNIKCGNSIIAPDYFSDLQRRMYDEEQMRHVNVFDWAVEFSDIMKSNGFDVVIGNPPWGAYFTDDELDYLRTIYRNIIVRMIDSFMFFVAKGQSLVRKGGYFGMILPDVILYQGDNEKLREHILKSMVLKTVVNLGNDVFVKVTRPSCILILTKGSDRGFISAANFSQIGRRDKAVALTETFRFSRIDQDSINKIPGLLFITEHPENYRILSRIQGLPNKPLHEFVDEDGIQRGVSPDLKEAFIVTIETIKRNHLEKEKIKPVYTGGKELGRYFMRDSDLWVIYTTRDDDFNKLPNICKYISSFKSQITCREVMERKHPLFSLHRPRKGSIFTKPIKIFGVITGDHISVMIDRKGFFATDGLFVFSLNDNSAINYIVGVLNSRLFVFLYRLLSLETGRVLAQVKPTILENMPIRTIDFSNPNDISCYDQIVLLVEQLISLHKKIEIEKTPDSREFLRRQIIATDKRIDQLVYELYRLSEKEITIVEEATGKMP